MQYEHFKDFFSVRSEALPRYLLSPDRSSNERSHSEYHLSDPAAMSQEHEITQGPVDLLCLCLYYRVVEKSIRRRKIRRLPHR